jgi:hypothetical protein
VGGLATSPAGVYSAGTAFLQVVPSFAGVEDAVKDQLRAMGRRLDASLEKGATAGLQKAGQTATAAGKKAAEDYTGAFNRDVQREISRALGDVGQTAGKQLLDPWNRAMDRVRTDIGALSKERVGFSIDENTFVKSVEGMRKRLELLERSAPSGADFYDARNARRRLDQVMQIIEDARRRGAQVGQEFTSAFATDVEKSVNKALSRIKPVAVNANTSGAQRELQVLRSQIQGLEGKKVGVDVDASQAFLVLERVQRQLKTLSESSVEAEVKYDAGQAYDSISKVVEDAQRAAAQAAAPTAQQIREQADRHAKYYGTTFSAAIERALDKGMRALPAVPLSVNTTDAETRLIALRSALEALSNRQIGVDVSSSEAYAELMRIQEAARELDNDDVNIDVRINARGAVAAIDELKRSAEDAEKKVSTIEKAATLSMTRLQYLIALGASIGSIMVPAAAAAAGAIGFIGTTAIAASAGVGVLALGLSGIGEAVDSMEAYAKDQAKTKGLVMSNNRTVAGSVDQVKQSTLGLRNAQRQADESAEDGQRAVADAIEAVSRARHDAGVAARDQARAEADAQRSVTRAEADAREARLALNAAIKEARKDLVDLRTELERNDVDQSKATTALIAARNELIALQMNPRASEVELRRARTTSASRRSGSRSWPTSAARWSTSSRRRRHAASPTTRR